MDLILDSQTEQFEFMLAKMANCSEKCKYLDLYVKVLILLKSQCKTVTMQMQIYYYWIIMTDSVMCVFNIVVRENLNY